MPRKIKFLIIALFLGCFISVSQALAEDSVKPIYSVAVSGNVVMNKADGYARIILTDTQGKEYLIYEASGPFDSGSFSFENTCEETCVLNAIVPKKVEVEVSEATIHIDQLFTIEDKSSMNTQVQSMGMQTYNEALDPVQEDIKIDKINQYIKDNNLQWTAGKTSVSGYSYEQKKKIFGLLIDGSNHELPNLQGFEYYTGGIFETTKAKNSPKAVAASGLPSSFDWRNRHGENWLTPVKDQRDCGSCWAFALNGTLEALTNLYFNKKLDVNLSEQNLISCYNLGSCGGLDILKMQQVLDKTKTEGVLTEDCFKYSAYDVLCSKCADWQKQRIFSGGVLSEIDYSDESYTDSLKRALIEYGPLYAAIPALHHAMVLIGYDTNTADNQTIWIFKNSHGSGWGVSGYIKIKGLSEFSIETDDYQKLSPKFIIPQSYIKINYLTTVDINCVDKDNDGYCNWGISKEKPSTCPASCKAEKDCNDSNKNLGPFDSSFNCLKINDIANDQKPIVGKINLPSMISPDTPIHLECPVSDDNQIKKCVLLVNGVNTGDMTLSQTNCKSCTTKIDSQFPEGDYSLSAKCWDSNDNITIGDPVSLRMGTAGFSIGTISPTEANEGELTLFETRVSYNKRIYTCTFNVDGDLAAFMSLDKNPCFDCKASVSYIFQAPGQYSVSVECSDQQLNKSSGGPLTVTVNATGSGECPDCSYEHTDLCKSPPKCEKDCGADEKCDEKQSSETWVTENTCHGCTSDCRYKSDPNMPSHYQLSGNTCYYNCPAPTCKVSGWSTVYDINNCEMDNCPATKTSDNICYYLRSCGVSGCKYLSTDTSKDCSKSVCTQSGWDNSKCSTPAPSPTPGPTPNSTWTPCDPTSGWKCGESSSGNSACNGKQISWGAGNDGEVVCPAGTIVTEGLCEGKNDDFVKEQTARVNLIASPAVFSNSTVFMLQGAWYCNFGCSKWFCGADGCAWAKCQAGSQSVDKIEIKIYNLAGNLVFNKTISNQGEIPWDGKNSQGQQLANGLYGYQAKVYLKNGKSYTTQEKIQIAR